jgi:hypothetical protein
VRKAISLGGDSDTLACMAGGIAQAFFGGVPEVITSRVYEVLDERWAMLPVSSRRDSTAREELGSATRGYSRYSPIAARAVLIVVDGLAALDRYDRNGCESFGRKFEERAQENRLICRSSWVEAQRGA